MAEQNVPEWRAHAAAGALLLLDTLALGYAPAGPWDAASFSLGVIGLTGMVLLYVAWYRFTFKRPGLIPWLDLWQDPAGSSKKVIIAGVATIVLAWVLGNPLQEQMPDPSGLILTLIGLLMLLNGIYVKLSIGPLADSK
jgi:ammonia channel protein AmtB